MKNYIQHIAPKNWSLCASRLSTDITVGFNYGRVQGDEMIVGFSCMS